MAFAFAFDANRHEYVDTLTGEQLPHITGMLESGGLIDDRWFTEESSYRGQCVHRLTADYDLGAIEDPQTVVSKYKGYLLGHVKASGIIRPTWQHIEEPMASGLWRFGGRPDRCGEAYGARAVLEVKSGDIDQRAHGVQTALQAILFGEELKFPPEFIMRYGLYVKDSGRYKLEQFVDRRDFDEAYRLIRRFCSM